MCLIQYFIFEDLLSGSVGLGNNTGKQTFRSRRCPTHVYQKKTTGVHSWLGKEERRRVVAMDALETKRGHAEFLDDSLKNEIHPTPELIRINSTLRLMY